MRTRRGKLRGGRAATLLATVAVSVLAAGCGGSSSSSSSPAAAAAGESGGGSSTSSASSNVAYARAQVAKYSPLMTHFTAPGPALQGVKGKLTGKTVWYIPVFLQAPIFTADAADLAQPLSLAGATVHVCNADSNPSTANSCITEAVKAHAAGIVIDAINYSFAPSAISSAIAAKIPLVATDNDNPEGFPKSSDVTTVDIGNPLDSRLAVDWIIADSGGHADLLYAADNSNDGVIEAAATKSELTAHCPGCQLRIVNFGDETVQNLATGVSSAMVRDPNINYVNGGYDAPSGIFALQGAKTVTGRKFTYITATGQPPGLQRLAAGQQAADPGMDTDLAMWNTADALFRIMLHQKPVAAYAPGVRIFTKANAPSNTKSAAAYASGAWYTNGAFKPMYTKLWGL